MKKISSMNRIGLSLVACVARPMMKLSVSIAAALLSAQLASASPYATSLTNNAGTISFRLNESASAVAVIFTNLTGFTVVSNLGPKSVGLTVTNLSVPGSYTISVTNFASPGYVSGLPIQISNDSTNGTPSTGGISTNTLRFLAPRGVAVNMNPTSTNFGRIYVANSLIGAAVRNTGDGIYVLNADYSDAVGQGATALTAGITAFTNAIAGSTDDGNTPWRIEVGEDNNLYISDYSISNGCIYWTDPSVTTGGNVLAGFGAASLGALNASPNHGRIGSSVIAKGSLANGNLVLYAIDTDTPMNSLDIAGNVISQANHILKWPIGSGPFPVDLAINTLVTNVDDAALLPNSGITEDMDIGPDGKLYVLQNRSSGGEGGVFVLDPTLDGVSAFNPFADGLADLVYDSRADSIGTYGASSDILFQSRALKISPDGKYMAVIRDDNQIWIIQLVNGIPDLSTRKLMVNTGTTTIGRDISFDAAGNLYVVSSGQQVMRVFSPGYKTIAQTSSKGTFSYTNIVPAVTVQVVGTLTNAAEPNVNGQFTFTRTGDLSQPLTVNYTISGTATRGVDYQTNLISATANASVTFLAGASSTNVDITVINDTLGEATETVIFTLVATTNYVSGSSISSTVFIADDGDPAVVNLNTIGSGSYELLPGRPAKFTVSILAVPGVDVVATINLSGTAVSGVDYVEPSTFTITIPNGILSTNFTITPIDNSGVSTNKTIIAKAAASPNYNVGNSATNILRNDDLNPGTLLFADDFDADHSANWQVQVKDADNSANIFFDYSTIGIPSAPHSVGGTTRGVRLKAHEAVVSSQNGVSVSPKGKNFSATGDYRLRFDMWMNFGYDFVGSTEMFLAGVGASEANLNCPFGTPRLAVYFGSTGEGGQGASGDYRVITNTTSLANGGIVTVGAPSGSRDNVDSYYDEFGDTVVPSAQAALFPTPQAGGITPRGCIGMMWHDVIITKTSTNVTWDIDGLRFITINTTAINSGMSTNIFLGYYDLNTGSIASVPNLTFGLVDNVRVESLAVTAPVITSVQIINSGANVQIDFTGNTADAPPAGFFTLQSANTVGGPYADVSSTMTAPGSGTYRAVRAVAGTQQFYRVKR